MAQRHDHYKRAEEFIARIDEMDASIGKLAGQFIDTHAAAEIVATRDYLMRRAEIHATLACAQIEGNPS